MAAAQLRGVVALDGPSGTGKSTVAKLLAELTDAGYLDTGSMYRAVTLAVLRAEADLADTDRVTMIVASSKLAVGTDPRAPRILLNGEDVGEQIRGAEVTAAVSAVSAVPQVRELLVTEQQRIIAELLESRGGIVVEGRDIGAVVAPDAPVKVFLTASADARARRRSRQDSAAGRVGDASAALASVQRRDHLDSTRAVSPLRQTPDQIELDTTELDIRSTVDKLMSIVDERGLRAERQA